MGEVLLSSYGVEPIWGQTFQHHHERGSRYFTICEANHEDRMCMIANPFRIMPSVPISIWRWPLGIQK